MGSGRRDDSFVLLVGAAFSAALLALPATAVAEPAAAPAAVAQAAAAQQPSDIWREPPEPSEDKSAWRVGESRQAALAEEWAPPVDELPRLRDQELLRAVPDLVVHGWPATPISLSLGLASRAPFQAFAVDVGVVLRSEWLRIELLYGAGGSVAPNMSGQLSHYSELILGLRLIHAQSERDVDVLPEDDSPWYKRGPRKPPRLKAWLPSHHALMVEAGMFTGAVALERCTGACEDRLERTLAADNHQLFYPFGGLRYTYLVHVTSKREPLLTRRIFIEAHAHAIIAPFPSPSEALWRDGEDVERLPVGARLQVDVAPCSHRCLQVGLMAGYLPVPATPIFGVVFKTGPF